MTQKHHIRTVEIRTCTAACDRCHARSQASAVETLLGHGWRLFDERKHHDRVPDLCPECATAEHELEQRRAEDAARARVDRRARGRRGSARARARLRSDVVSDLPPDMQLRFRRAVRALDHGGGVTRAVIVAISATGHYQVCGTDNRLELARILRMAADHIERTAPKEKP